MDQGQGEDAEAVVRLAKAKVSCDFSHSSVAPRQGCIQQFVDSLVVIFSHFCLYRASLIMAYTMFFREGQGCCSTSRYSYPSCSEVWIL